jgi:hypothetical protein
MLDLPGGDEEQKGDGGVCCRARTEHHVTCIVVPFVASGTEVAAAGTDVSDNGEGEETECSHEETIDELVCDQLRCENTLLVVVWWSVHAVFLRLFKSETDGEEGRGDEVDPENLNGGQREDGVVILVLEGETDEKEDDLSNVRDEKMHKELQHQILVSDRDGGEERISVPSGCYQIDDGLLRQL